MKKLYFQYLFFSIYICIRKEERRPKNVFLSKQECLLIESECIDSRDECCRDDYLKCTKGINRSGALVKFSVCQNCFNQECVNESDCCEGSFPCIKNKCSFPKSLPCNTNAFSSFIEKDPQHCFNALFGCYQGTCQPCGGRKCKNSEDCCLEKGYTCDSKNGICQKLNKCVKEKNTCASNEDCCHPLGCKGFTCDYCMRAKESCTNTQDCCNGFKCENGFCKEMKKDGESCILDEECQSFKCVMGICGVCSKPLSLCKENKDCCDNLQCVQKPDSDEFICSKEKICASLSESCADIDCCQGKCVDGKCKSCILGKCFPEKDVCCGEERCLPSLDVEGEFRCQIEKVCAGETDFCNPPTLKCCHGECQAHKCVNCFSEQELCLKDGDCCDGFECREDNSHLPLQKVCQGKKKCSKIKEECNSFIECCEGMCLRGVCEKCLLQNRECDMGTELCCEGLRCVTDKGNTSRKVCFKDDQCVANWGKCKANDDCCSHLCHMGKCSVCHSLKESCDSNPCCENLKCVTDPSGNGKKICSEEPLCAFLNEDCGDDFACCPFQGICFHGKCSECKKLNSPCTSDGIACCGKLICTVNPLLPEEKICATQKLCKTDGEDCSENDELACCNALCYKGKCSKCVIPFKECSQEGLPCCGKFECVSNPLDPEKFICSEHQLCAPVNTRCNKLLKCCQGECVESEQLCRVCRKRFEVCSEKIKCCEPMQCVDEGNPKEPGRTVCNFKKICLDLDQECSETSLPCCRGDCINKKCKFCHLPFQKCSLDEECCRGMKCNFESTGQYKICMYSPSCITSNGNCSQAECCPQYNCFNSVCMECQTAGKPCDGKCCPGLNCIWSNDGSSKICSEKNETCIILAGKCGKPDAQCCQELTCYKGICSKCNNVNLNCTNETECCEGLKCTWNDKGDGKICAVTENCVKEDGKCEKNQKCCSFLTCWEEKCQKCVGMKNPCERTSECCKGMNCTWNKLGERKFCWNEEVCIEENGNCKHQDAKCCEGFNCVSNRCRNCLGQYSQCQNSTQCCDDMACIVDQTGEKRICVKNSALCVVELGSCLEPDSKCCLGNYCSMEKRCKKCRKQEESCVDSLQCCSGLFCTVNKYGNGKICDDQFGCVEQFGMCNEENPCCKGLTCWKGRCDACEGCKECRKEAVLCHMYKFEELKAIEEELRQRQLAFDLATGLKASEILIPMKPIEKPEKAIKGMTAEKVIKTLSESQNVKNQKDEINVYAKLLNATIQEEKSQANESSLNSNSSKETETEKVTEKETTLNQLQKSPKIPQKTVQISPLSLLMKNSSPRKILSQLRNRFAKRPLKEFVKRGDDVYSTFRFLGKVVKRCCYGLVCTWDSSGTYTYCDEEIQCVAVFGTCTGYNAHCCQGLNCFEGTCKPCSLFQEDCSNSTCCGENICTFTDDGKQRLCQKEANCVKPEGECTHWDAKCCTGLLCFNGKCQSCGIDGDICELKPCCLSFNCLLDSTGLVKTCTKKLDTCSDVGGSCQRFGSKCCDHLFCDREKSCQKCSAEGEECPLDPNSCCQGFHCSIDKTGTKMLCSTRKVCVAIDGECKVSPHACCEGLICNHKHQCVPPYLEENQQCRFDLLNRTTNESASVYLDPEASAPFEPCKSGFGCFLENTGYRRICQKETVCVVNEGSCLHPESKCCDGTYCKDEVKLCQICRTENSTCSEEHKCCPGFLCSLDSLGHAHLCMKAPVCQEKHADCTNGNAKCCPGLSCLGPTDKDSLKNIKPALDLDVLKKIPLLKLEAEYYKNELNKEQMFIQLSGTIKKSCVNCLPMGHECDSSEGAAGYKCCSGLFCTVSDDGGIFTCEERKNCVKEKGLCALEGVTCCVGYKCNRKGRCHAEFLQDHPCTDEPEMCADGLKCFIDATGRTRACSSEPICVKVDGDCTSEETKCCVGFFCEEGVCKEVAKCLKESASCELEDHPLPCCQPMKCYLDSKGLLRKCQIEEVCVEKEGKCHHVDAKCCAGLVCDERRRCSCGEQGDTCEHGQLCCDGNTCQWDIWGEKQICSGPKTCVIEGGRCDHSDCCAGLICKPPKRAQNSMIPSPIIPRCQKPIKCVKEWASCDKEEKPCCDGFICAKDVFETGDFCQKKAIPGTQCYSSKLCKFGDPELECIHNICTSKNHKCSILTEECEETKCCEGYVCVVWGDKKRCKKDRGFKCVHSDDCEKFCDPIYGKCSDEELPLLT